MSSESNATNSDSKGENEELMDDILTKLLDFKQFDTVEDYSDHFYRDKGLVGNNHQPPNTWAKKIQEEWKILQELARAYESRMDLLRAAIIGPDGTPYHDGVFFFDIMFPSSYPNKPPVHYHSGGLGINPNLYENGYVCLSLLGTWSGTGTEMWLPDKSTMLQVLLSIQALILNSDPFYNEPGYERYKGGEKGMRLSKAYTEEVFILSLKTMAYSLNNPPKHFEDLVAGHFRMRALDILTACKLYNEGVVIGSDIKRVKQDDKVEGSNFAQFKKSLAGVVELLVKAFDKNGSKDCDEFSLTE